MAFFVRWACCWHDATLISVDRSARPSNDIRNQMYVPPDARRAHALEMKTKSRCSADYYLELPYRRKHSHDSPCEPSFRRHALHDNTLLQERVRISHGHLFENEVHRLNEIQESTFKHARSVCEHEQQFSQHDSDTTIPSSKMLESKIVHGRHRQVVHVHHAVTLPPLLPVLACLNETEEEVNGEVAAMAHKLSNVNQQGHMHGQGQVLYLSHNHSHDQEFVDSEHGDHFPSINLKNCVGLITLVLPQGGKQNEEVNT